MHKREEFVGAMLLRSGKQTDLLKYFCKGQDSVLKFEHLAYIGLQCCAERRQYLTIVNEGFMF